MHLKRGAHGSKNRHQEACGAAKTDHVCCRCMTMYTDSVYILYNIVYADVWHTPYVYIGIHCYVCCQCIHIVYVIHRQCIHMYDIHYMSYIGSIHSNVCQCIHIVYVIHRQHTQQCMGIHCCVCCRCMTYTICIHWHTLLCMLPMYDTIYITMYTYRPTLLVYVYIHLQSVYTGIHLQSVYTGIHC